MTKRIVTFLLAIAMVFAMPISINAAESPIEPQNVNGSTSALFMGENDIFFDGYDEDYGQYKFAVNFYTVSEKDSRIKSASVYTDIAWEKELPYKNTTYTVKVSFIGEYQRANHYSHGKKTMSYTEQFSSKDMDSGFFRIPTKTFSLSPPTLEDDSQGFSYWISFAVRIDLYLPNGDVDDPYDFVSYGVFSVPYSEVMAKL